MGERGSAKTLGITVMPEWIQVEGIDALLDNLQGRAGATAIATSPYVMEPADKATGGREPPIDAGAGAVRLLDRELWGKRELFCRTAPSYAADLSLFRGCRYQPTPANDLTAREGHKVGDFIRAARARGIEVWLQVQAAIPPGYRVQFGGPAPDDQPLLPDGRKVARQVDKNGSLASPHIVAYVSALLADLAKAYPEVDGFRIDWPEYPPYTLDAVFLDFSDHAMREAVRRGYDAERMRRDAAAAYAHLHHGLTDAELRAVIAAPGELALSRRWPGLADLWRFKADLVVSLLDACRKAVPAGKKLAPQSFPPPWTQVSGFDHARAAPFADAIGVKLYTMHWPMMLRFYADAVAAGNPDLDHGMVAKALVALLATGGPEPSSIEDLRYPDPDETHPVGAGEQTAKIRAAQQAAGSCPVLPFSHAYGPVEDVAKRAAIAWEAGPHGIWVNRYGYLSDAKLDRLGALPRG